MAYNRVRCYSDTPTRMVQLGYTNSDGVTRMPQLGWSNSDARMVQLGCPNLDGPTQMAQLIWIYSAHGNSAHGNSACINSALKGGVTQDFTLLQTLFRVISSIRNSRIYWALISH